MLLLILYGAYLVISPVITAITWAVILAILVYPLYAWLLEVLRGAGMIDNILKPLLIGNRLGLPVLLLFFGILGGISLFGTVGIIIGPAPFALSRALLDLYSQEYATPINDS